jgi:hypothetical protein
MSDIPPGWNHPDSSPVKPEEPVDFFNDKPVPRFTFGNLLQCSETGKLGEVIGIQWRQRHGYWIYCLDCTGEGYGQWFIESNLKEVANG